MPDIQTDPAFTAKGRRRWRGLVASVAALVLLVAAGAAWRAASRPAPIVIAFAGSLSGGGKSFGDKGLAATQIFLDEVNAAGGVGGHPVVLQLFDDQSRPDVARAGVPAVLDSPAIAVLGHTLSATSVAAGQAYSDGRIPVVAGNASADEVMQNKPYYFRAQSANTVQGGSWPSTSARSS